ncbi:SH3 domain-binding glutamic acid-rich-like protein 3 [Haliotis rufescens]|uniref:SH3 domain-binding glutamic acid-rich-like protein 3 n=1 Tax=Haliotis rufescens TaxID=6454 RepID=UPI001EAF9C88|nr:SH3 domain-binding glutamic acid-rich-like protein 3 [Haliotis rufescens]
MSNGDAQIKVYVSSMSPNANTVCQQNKIEQVLEAKKVSFIKIDIASNPDYKDEMRAIMGDERGLAPQICNGNEYCGNYETFADAIELGTLFEFLKLPSPVQEQS